MVCHTLTWIHHGCTCVPHPEPPSHLPPHPIPLDHPSAPALEHPVSCIEPGLAIHFTYDNLHVSMPFSHIISPSLSPTESKRLFNTSVSLLLSHIHNYRYHLSVAAAAAKLLHSCPTLCNPIDGSLPGTPVPGFLQARTLEWVAISFSNAWKWKVKVMSLRRVWLFATPWTAAHQAPLSMGFSRQEHWSELPLSSPPSF